MVSVDLLQENRFLQYDENPNCKLLLVMHFKHELLLGDSSPFLLQVYFGLIILEISYKFWTDNSEVFLC